MTADIYKTAELYADLYFRTFDDGRHELQGFYGPLSTMCMDGDNIAGDDAIMEKLNALPGTKHTIHSKDPLPNSFGDGFLVVAAGEVSIEGEDAPKKFTRALQVAQHQDKTYWIMNDIFRLT